MWVKVLYCTKDQEYAKKLTLFFDVEYRNQMELNICTSIERAIQLLQGIDIFLVGEEFREEINSKRKMIACPVVVMTENRYESIYNDLVQIEKYQRADNIYKELLDVYAQGDRVKIKRPEIETNKKQRIYVFTSAGGGSGTTTIARSFAQKCSVYERTLYLDFDLYGVQEVESGQKHGMDELIMALKSRRNILPLKLNSVVSKCVYGFYSYGTCTNPINLLEINTEDMKVLMDELLLLNEYSRIIIDIGTALTERELVVLNRADYIVYITDEQNSSIQKFAKFLELLDALEKRENIKLSRKILLFKNKVSREFDNHSGLYDYQVKGWAPFVEMQEESEIIRRIAASDSFNNLEV